MKNIFLLALAATVLAACDRDDNRPPNPDPNVEPTAVQDSISVNPLIATLTPTRTAISGSTASWANNDAIGIFCPQARGTSSANVAFTVTGLPGSPVWTPATTMYWADGTTFHKFVAYAPYAAGNSSSSAVKLPSLAGQTGTAITPAQDFLYSKNQWTTGVQRGAPTAVPLTFTHALSLIEFDVTINSSITAGTTLTSFVLASPTTGDKLYTTDANSTIDLSSGSITTTGGTTSNTQTVTPGTPPVLSATSTPLYALILPGTFTSPTLAITISESSTALTLSTVTLGTTLFEAGKKYTYTVNISRSAITISTPTITDWTVVASGTTLNPGL